MEKSTYNFRFIPGNSLGDLRVSYSLLAQAQPQPITVGGKK